MAVFILIIVWRFGNWSHWKDYHATMLYFSIGNLTYNFLIQTHFLWRFKPDFLTNYLFTEMLYTFIVFPATVLLFIGNYPQEKRKVLFHYSKWILIYVGFELLFVRTGHIQYQFGWSLGWSFLFDCIMFPMLRLHFKYPALAYLLSIPIALFFIWRFHIPVNALNIGP